MPTAPEVTAADRYQMRNAVLHTGTTLTRNTTAKQPRYTCFSFVDPRNFQGNVGYLAEGNTLTVNVGHLANDTRQAMHAWFARLQNDSARMAEVVRNLPELVRVKPKTVHLPQQGPSRLTYTIQTGMTTSSS